jgi:hypothetical protein
MNSLARVKATKRQAVGAVLAVSDRLLEPIWHRVPGRRPSSPAWSGSYSVLLSFALSCHSGPAGYARLLKSAVEQLAFDQHRCFPTRGQGFEILFADLEQRPL